MELVPFDHGGGYSLDSGGAGSLYPANGVVLLVGPGPFDQGTGCPWWVRKSGLTRLPMNQAFSLRCITPAIGQGGNALLKGCLIPRPQRVNMWISTRLVDNDASLHGVHTDTVAFSPTVLIKCSICSYPH